MKNIIFFLGCLSLISAQITKVGELTFNDYSTWRSASAASNSHLWISDNYVYYVQPTVGDNGGLSLLGSAAIPSQYQFQVALYAQYNEFQNTFNIVLIPKSDSTTLLEVQVDISGGDWSTIRSVSLDGVSSSTKWQQIISDQPGIPGTMYIFALEYIVAVGYDNFAFVSGTSYPGDAHFPITTVSGTGIAPPYGLEGAALYASRASNSSGGDIVLFKISVPGFMQFDHQVYLLTSPETFFVFGAGLSPYLYWLQTESTEGTIYKWDYQNQDVLYTTVSFQSGEVWSTAWALEDYGNYVLLASGTDQYTSGYTLRTINLQSFQQSDSLQVTGDTLPTISLEADYGSGGYAVVGTRDGASNKLKLVLYQYAPYKKRSVEKIDENLKKTRGFELIEENISHPGQLPPTCTQHPPCGPSIGMSCSGSQNCYLDLHEFMCCTVCPDEC